MGKNRLAMFAVTAALSLSLAACKDTKTLQENDQLKAQVAELQKENGQLGNQIDTLTAARDALTKENATLKTQIAARNTRKQKRTASRKSSKRKRRQA